MKRLTIKTEVTTSVDLGPAEPHMYVPTVVVRRKRDGLLVTINKSDLGGKNFPGRDYELVDDPEDTVDTSNDPAPQPEVPKASIYTRDDLAEMSVPTLKTLPEYAKLDQAERKKIKTRGDLVDAIIAARSK